MSALTRQATVAASWGTFLLGSAWAIFRSNLRLAFFALGLSAVLWVVVTNDQNPPRVDLFPNTVPIEALNLPPGFELTKGIDGASVRVAAPSESWGRLRTTSFRLTVDLSNAQTGVNEYPVVAQVSDPLARVVEVVPDRVTVLVEQVVSRTVPVRVNVPDSVPFGFTSGLPKAAPDSVTVIGPDTKIRQVDAALATVRLDGAKVSLNQSVKLVAVTASGEPITGVRIEPQTAGVEIAVDQQLVYRVVPVTPNVVGLPATGYWIQSAVAEPATVTIVGDRAAIEDLPFISTNTIDVTGIDSVQTRTTTLALPPGVSVASGGSYRVRINAAVQTGSRPFSVAPAVNGLGAGLSATPETVDFVVTGPVPGLRSPDFAATVAIDVSGLGPGDHVVQPQVTVPAGYQIGQAPRAITVTIR